VTRSETLPFQAEAKELLGLVIHSLYSHPEIFLRELLSNASDALDKLRYEALTRPELLAGAEPLAIRIDVERSKRTLAVSDDGIGMSRDEVATNLGTIARSGTRKFLESLREKGSTSPDFIGQFGVGFYASFMVASCITVTTRRAGESGGTRWSSRGDGEFTLEDAPDAPAGTRVELQLRESEGEDGQDFSDAALVRALVRKYSDFVEWPIQMAASCFAGDGTLKRSRAADGVEVVTLNSQRPLWARPKDEITADEHAQFFRHLTHGWGEPTLTVHFVGEGVSSYTALFYVPRERPDEWLEPAADRSRIALYVRRVFVMGDCEELLPTWLRFVRGVVDSQDLPLNVSREILQHDRSLPLIAKRCTRKVLDALAAMKTERRADYENLFANFGSILKEGAVMEREHSEALAELLLFPSTGSEAPVALSEYVERCPKDQQPIYVFVGRDRESARRSPHLEQAARKGLEVLLFVEPIDEWLAATMREHKGRKLVDLGRDEPEFASEAEKFELERLEREHRALLERLETHLSEHVSRVRYSPRLAESPALLADDPHAPRPHMAAVLERSGRNALAAKRVLELNPSHPLIQRLGELGATADSAGLEDFSRIVHGFALLAEGSALPDPARFARLVSDLMLASVK
jgi:molecular chaperone HtpG